MGAPNASAADRFLETTDGTRLHYLEVGEGDPIVFVPGWRCPAFIWEKQLEFFAPSHRVVALDPRGHGGSDQVVEGLFRERRAQDIGDLLEAASLEDAVLVGWSMAMPEVLSYVQQFGTDRLRGIVLVDWPFRFSDEFKKGIGGYMLQFLRDPAAVSKGLMPVYFTTAPEPEFVDRLLAATDRMPTSAAVAVLVDYMVDGGEWDATLRALDCPLLYAVSPAFAEDARQLQALVPNAMTRVFGNAGHAFFVDQHEAFNRALEEFLGRISQK